MSGEELEASAPLPGKVLAEAREAIGVTQREVADALNLPVHTVEAIEAGDESRLPASVFTRGYIRAYAKLLDLDPEPLIVGFVDEENLTAEFPAVEEERDERPLVARLGVSTNQLAIIGGGALAVVIVIFMIALVFGGGDDTPAPVAVSPEASGDPTLPAVASSTPTAVTEAVAAVPGRSDDLLGEPAIDEALDEPIDTTLDESAAEVFETVNDLARAEVTPPQREPEPAPEQEPRRAQEPAPVAPQPAPPDSVAAPTQPVADQPEPVTTAIREARTRRLTDGGDDTLSLEFAADCWVEIKDVDRRPLFADLGRAGQRLSFVGEGPFWVKLGYAPGVFVTYNEQVIGLRPYTRRDVATLVIGRDSGQ